MEGSCKGWERNSRSQCRLGLQQASGWNKQERVVLNALEQMEKTQHLNSNAIVSHCALPGSGLGVVHGSGVSNNLCSTGIRVGGVERRKGGLVKYHKD